MKNHEAFMRIFQLPPAMHPYLNLIATQREIDLVVGLEETPLTREEVAEMMRISGEESEQLLREAYKRDIIQRVVENDKTRYTPGRFYSNLDYLSAYETGTWRRLPSRLRRDVAEWQLLEFIEMWKPAIDQIARDADAWVRIKNRDVLLLDQALEMVAASEFICLLPCQCKTTLFPDSPRVEGSMRLGERARLTLEQGQGRALTVEQAQSHLLNLDRMGLVHTGPRQWRENDPNLEWVSHGNCHPAYSFPFLAGERLGLEKRYPRAYYLAVVNWERCSHCGICVGRCPFGAFSQDGTEVLVHGGPVRQIVYNEDRCWGCGLCVGTCPEEAIQMDPLV